MKGPDGLNLKVAADGNRSCHESEWSAGLTVSALACPSLSSPGVFVVRSSRHGGIGVARREREREGERERERERQRQTDRQTERERQRGGREREAREREK